MILQVPGSRVRLTGTSVSSRHVHLGSPKSLLAFLVMVWACRSQERVTSLLLLPLGEGERSFFWLLLPPVLPPSVSWLQGISGGMPPANARNVSYTSNLTGDQIHS